MKHDPIKYDCCTTILDIDKAIKQHESMALHTHNRFDIYRERLTKLKEMKKLINENEKPPVNTD
jgi:hypothetical protein